MAAGGGDDFGGIDAAALPFVTVNEENDQFEVNPEAVRYLSTITGKVAVVTIAGEPPLPATRAAQRSESCAALSRAAPCAHPASGAAPLSGGCVLRACACRLPSPCPSSTNLSLALRAF